LTPSRPPVATVSDPRRPARGARGRRAARTGNTTHAAAAPPPAARTGSALRELRGPARLAEADLLALDFARVARHEACTAQMLTQRLAVRDQRARDPVTNRAGLPGRAAAADRRPNVELALELGRDERLSHDHPRRLAAEELVERTAVHGDLAGAGPQEHA